MKHVVVYEYSPIKRDVFTSEEIKELKLLNRKAKLNLRIDDKKIRFSQYVGLILLSTGKTIEILPKIYSNYNRELKQRAILNARKLLTILFYDLLDLTKQPPAGGSIYSKNLNFNIPFLEIVILLTLIYIEKKIIQPGIYKSYMRETLTSKSMNGKILLSKTLLKFPFQKTKFVIEKEILTENVLINQILLGLTEFVASRFKNLKIKNLASKISLYLKNSGVISPKSMVEALKQVHINRMNNHYQPAIQLSRLLFFNKSLTGSEGTSFVFLYDMNKLFESFVAKSSPEFIAQSTESIDTDFILKPDILWPIGGRKYIVIDTKWKYPSNTSSETGGVYQSDRFQVITYMYVLAERKNIQIPIGVLLYPELPGEKKVWNISDSKKLVVLGLGLKTLIENEKIRNIENLDIQVLHLKRRILEKLKTEILKTFNMGVN